MFLSNCTWLYSGLGPLKRGIKREVDEALSPDIYALVDVCSPEKLQYLHTVFDCLESNRRTIMDDPFIRNFIEGLLKNIRTQVLLKLIKPYTRIRIPFISKENFKQEFGKKERHDPHVVNLNGILIFYVCFFNSMLPGLIFFL